MKKVLQTFRLSDVFRNFSINTVNLQRGNMSKKSSFFYAVRRGHNPGVYPSWQECLAQVSGFSNASYKKFPTYQEAEAFANNKIPLGVNSKILQTKKVEEAPPLPPGQFAVSLMPPELHPMPVQKGTKRKKNCQTNKQSPGPKRVAHIKKIQEKNATSGLVSSLFSRVEQLEKELAEIKGKKTCSAASTFQPSVPITMTELKMEHLEIPQTMVHVYTDGACTKNGFSGAMAGIGVYWGPDHPLNVSERLQGRQTNNRAEIQAAVRALQQAKTVGIKEITVYTDSNFLINGVTKWVKKWKQNGWILSTGQPVINRADFEDLEKASAGLSITWVHVPGHRGVAGNEAADHLAVQGIQKPLIP